MRTGRGKMPNALGWDASDNFESYRCADLPVHPAALNASTLTCHELRRSQVVREAVRPRGSSVAPVEAPFRSYSRNGSVLSEQKGEILWGGKPATVHNPTPRYRRDALQGRGTRKGKMKLQHAAALALVGWYLIHPPVPHLSALDSHTDTAALPSWTVASTFPTQARPSGATHGNDASQATTRALFCQRLERPWGR